ncbi:MAG: PDZ domain-containing protein [Cyanobacteria bacterium J06650_10]
MAIANKRIVVSVMSLSLFAAMFVTSTAVASDYIGVELLLTERNIFEGDPISGETVIRGTIPGSPAVDAGIMAGDVVLSVNGQTTEGLTTTDIVELITQAQADSTVELVLNREGQTTEVLVAKAPIEEPESWIPLMDGQGEFFSGLSAVVTPFVSGCPGTGLNPTFNDISFLAPLPPADQRRIVITNQRTGGYTNRAYDGARERSESFDIALGERHSTRYLTVLPGENILSYKVLENGDEVGSASFLLSVRQEGPPRYWPYNSVGQQLCPNGLPRALPPTTYPPYPYNPSLLPSELVEEFVRESEHLQRR